MKKYVFSLICLCFLGLCISAEAAPWKLGRGGTSSTSDRVKLAQTECGSGQILVGYHCIVPETPRHPSNCSDGQVWNTERGICTACPENCLECKEKCSGEVIGKYCTENKKKISYSYVCKRCSTGLVPDASGKCIHECSSGQVWDERANACVTKCEDGKIYNPVAKACVEKSIGCKSSYCASCPDQLYCSSCVDGYDLNESGECVEKLCGDGEVYSPVVKKCIKSGCDDSFGSICGKCVTTETGNSYCAECNPEHMEYGKVYMSPFDGQCHYCDDAYATDELHCNGYCGNIKGNVVCRGCQDGYSLDKNGVCREGVRACEAGTYYSPVKDSCISCPEGCDSCYTENYDLYNDRLHDTSKHYFHCNNECGEGKYRNQGECLACPAYCTACKGIYTDGELTDVACTACTTEYDIKLIDGQCAKHNQDEWGVIENCEYYAKGCIVNGKAVNNEGGIRCPKTSIIICKLCKDGYTIDVATGQCVRKGGEVQCAAGSHCTYCAEGCKLEDGVGGGGNTCDGRPTFAVCKECEDGYQVDFENGTCIKEKDFSCAVGSHCTYCTEGCIKNGSITGGGNVCDGYETFAVCKECEGGYKVDFSTGKCVKETKTECEVGSHCTYCAEGCKLKDGSIAGGGNVCDGYETFAVCKACEDGYQVDENSGTCVKIKDFSCAAGSHCTYCTEGCMIKGSVSGGGNVCDGYETFAVCKECEDGYEPSKDYKSCVEIKTNNCGDGYVYSPVVGQCIREKYGCDEVCKACGEGYCEACGTGYVMVKKADTDGMWPGRCHARCTSIDGCEICGVGGTADGGKCQQCADGYTLYEGTCLKGNEVSTASACLGSIQNCKVCASKNECKICADGYLLENGKCVKDVPVCPTGTYLNIQGECTKCAPGTYSDTEGVTSCKDCPAGFYSNEGAKSCVKCSAGTYAPVEGTPKCTACAAGTYSGEAAKSCSACPANCTYCAEGCTKNGTTYTGGGNVCDGYEKIAVCKECEAGYVVSGAQCTFKDQESCLKVVDNCKICASQTECRTCAGGFELRDGECVEIAEICYGNIQNCSLCANEKECKLCDDGYYLENGKCYTEASNVCYGTVENCKVCASETACKTCTDDFYEEAGQCYIKNKKACYGNVENCKVCATKEACKTCEDGFYLENGKCVFKEAYACYGYVPNCEICASKNACKTCQEGYDLKEGQCYFGDQTTCHKYDDACTVCASKETCQVCKDGYELKDGKCVK